MTSKTRRQVLIGTGAVVAAGILPSVRIPGLTPLTTLKQLATDGKYVSVLHHLPDDVHTADYRFSLDGKPLPEGTYVMEMYAPGDESGWAVVFNHKDGERDVNGMPIERVVRGNWKFWRLA